MITKKVYTFKKGQLTDLDSIYEIQGLGGGDWWEKTGADVRSGDKMGYDLGEHLIITKNITITITITVKSDE